MMRRLVLWLVSVVLMTTACSENDADKVIMFVECSSYEPASGETVRFDISTFTTDGSVVSRVDVESFDSEYGLQQLKSIPAGIEKFQYSYEYKVPVFTKKDISIDICFTSVSSNSDFRKIIKKIFVNTEHLLGEYTNIDLFPSVSAGRDAFSLSSLQPIFSNTADESDIDIYISASGELCSKTDVLFSKALNFNYPAASAVSVQDMYKNSIVTKSVGNLAKGDIILLGRGNSALGVIKIVNVINSDRITFNIKVIDTQVDDGQE